MIKMTIYTLHSKAFSKILMYTVTKRKKKHSNSEHMKSN